MIGSNNRKTISKLKNELPPDPLTKDELNDRKTIWAHVLYYFVWPKIQIFCLKMLYLHFLFSFLKRESVCVHEREEGGKGESDKREGRERYKREEDGNKIKAKKT